MMRSIKRKIYTSHFRVKLLSDYGEYERENFGYNLSPDNISAILKGEYGVNNSVTTDSYSDTIKYLKITYDKSEYGGHDINQHFMEYMLADYCHGVFKVTKINA